MRIDAYHKRRYSKKGRDADEFNFNSEEVNLLFDVESYSEYENVNPGTVTVEGFGLEAWEYEEMNQQGQKSIFVNCSKPKNIPARKLLRRIDELQQGIAGSIGWSRDGGLADLFEFTAGMIMYLDPQSYRYEEHELFSGLCSLLNRTDIFFNFLSTSSVGAEWSRPNADISEFWNFLWQIIIAEELLRRMEAKHKDRSTTSFTPQVLA